MQEKRGIEVIGRRRAYLLTCLTMLLSLVLPSAAGALEQKLIAADGAAFDQFGSSVAVDGDTLVIGAPYDDGSKGAVYVFQRSGDSWLNTAKLTASDGAANDEFGTAVAIDADTIVVGAPRDDAGAVMNQGSAYTFARTGPAARTETAKLTASDGVLNDFFGVSVAIDGDTIVAGAFIDDVGANVDQGSAYTFARTGPAARTETAQLIASDGAPDDQLGLSVAIDGDTIVAGAYLDDIAANADQGSVYTFARTGPAARTETAKLTASGGAADDQLGFSVAIDGGTVAAGAPFHDIGANTNQGSSFTFARTGPAARTETAKLTASDGAADDALGISVAVDGEAIVAGAFGDDVGTNATQGSAYSFARAGAAARTETGKLTASDGAAGDQFGFSVAIDGETIVAGVLRDAVGLNALQGSASVFFSPAPTPDITPPNTIGLKGPRKVEQGRKAKFRFSSTELGSTFHCKLDKKKFKPCSSPRKLKTKRLKPGRHRFQVYAVDAAGNADTTPAKKAFKVVR